MTIERNSSKFIIRAILFCIVFTLLLVILSMAKGFMPLNWERWAHGIIGTIAAFLTTIIFLRIDKKRFSDIGLRWENKTILRFFSGVLVGIILMGILVGSYIYFSNGGVELNRQGNLLNFLLITAPLLPLAYMEELGFRAYPLVVLEKTTGVWLSLIITSILFALYHVVNGWSLASSFYGPAIWGLIFGLAAIYSKGIAMPTGIHYAANLTTAAFGEDGNDSSIFTINNLTDREGTNWIAILSGLGLLLFALLCIVLYVRKQAKLKYHTGN